jgi:hypothetical protein
MRDKTIDDARQDDIIEETKRRSRANMLPHLNDGDKNPGRRKKEEEAGENDTSSSDIGGDEKKP